MFKDDSINLTYKRLQLLETNDKSMQEGGRVKHKRFSIVIKRKCGKHFRMRLLLGDRVRSQRHETVCCTITLLAFTAIYIL